jgi:hypothetical protein
MASRSNKMNEDGIECERKRNFDELCSRRKMREYEGWLNDRRFLATFI